MNCSKPDIVTLFCPCFCIIFLIISDEFSIQPLSSSFHIVFCRYFDICFLWLICIITFFSQSNLIWSAVEYCSLLKCVSDFLTCRNCCKRYIILIIASVDFVSMKKSKRCSAKFNRWNKIWSCKSSRISVFSRFPCRYVLIKCFATLLFYFPLVLFKKSEFYTVQKCCRKVSSYRFNCTIFTASYISSVLQSSEINSVIETDFFSKAKVKKLLADFWLNPFLVFWGFVHQYPIYNGIIVTKLHPYNKTIA